MFPGKAQSLLETISMLGLVAACTIVLRVQQIRLKGLLMQLSPCHSPHRRR